MFCTIFNGSELQGLVKGFDGSVQIEGLRVQVTVSDTVTMTLLALVGVGDQVVQTTRQVRVVDE